MDHSYLKKLKILTSSALLLLNCSHPLFAQKPLIEWDKSYGGTGGEIFQSMQQTSDGGYILGGFSNSPQGGMKSQPPRDTISLKVDYWIIKTDSAGVKQWDKTYGGDNADELHVVKQTSDGGYILGGASLSSIYGDRTQSNYGDYDGWLIKLDANGNKQWDKVYGSSLGDHLVDLQQTSDGGYILGLVSHSPQGGNKSQNTYGVNDYWIVKVDSSGVIQWQKTIGGQDNDQLYVVQQTSDGGYILGGHSRSAVSGNKTALLKGGDDLWIVKLNSSGVIQWDKTFGTTADDLLMSMQQTSDGGYILGGTSMGFGRDKSDQSKGFNDFWLVKTDANGNKVWDKTLGGISGELLVSVKQTNDGGYIACGFSFSGTGADKTDTLRGSNDYWVVKTGSNGNLQWDMTLGGNDSDQPSVILQTMDGSYIVGGTSTSDPGAEKTEPHLGFGDYWLVKLTAGSATGIKGIQLSDYELHQNFPNPFSQNTLIRFKLPRIENIQLLVYNNLGQVVAKHIGVYSQGQHELEWQKIIKLKRLPAGVYYYQLKSGNFHDVKRMVIKAN